MQPTPAVSVIIPTYNRAKTIERAVNSVLNQTFSDLELLVVDDCSTDDTAEIIKNYKDERLVYIRHEKNRGEGGARNTGIQNSRAEYIAFLDSDDEWLPDKLSKQLQLIQESLPNIGVVYSHYIMQYEGSFDYNIQRPSMKGDIFLDLLSGKCFLPSTAIIRSTCFTKYLHDETLPNYQDWDLWLQIAHDYQFDYVAEPLSRIYLNTPVQATRNIKSRLRGLDLFMNKWGNLIVEKFGKKQIRKIRDDIISTLYVVVGESVNVGEKLNALGLFFQLVFRLNDLYRGPNERVAIIYNFFLLLLGRKWHEKVITFFKGIRRNIFTSN